MTDITLLINDPSLLRLLRIELERIGKSVGENGEDCALLITDTIKESNISHKNKIIISRELETDKKAIVLKRPVDMSELRLIISDLFKQTEPKAEFKRKKKPSFKLLKEEKAVIVGNEKVTLTENEFVLLSALSEKRGELISRDEINELLNASGNTPEVYICGLRKKLAQRDGVNPIITVRGKGYKLR